MSFVIEKNNVELWDLYYGDIAGFGNPIKISPLDFGSNSVTHIDIGSEDIVLPISQYSTILSTIITKTQYKNNNVWIDVPTNTKIIEIVNEGYTIDVCASEVFGADAIRHVICRILGIENTSPTLIIN